MKKITLKFFIMLLCAVVSSKTFAQDVDLLASVDVSPPLSVGQTFTYTIATVPSSPYRGVQVYLNYNQTVIQLNSLTPDNSTLIATFLNDTSTPGIIQYASGAFSNINTGTVVFTAEFEVISTSESVMIEHDLNSGGNPNGTAVTNAGGQDILGTANDIILATLSVDSVQNLSDSISVYPNPAQDFLNIDFGNMGSAIETIQMFSLDGKLIQEISPSSILNDHIRIDTSAYENAMYLLQVRSVNNDLETFKIAVNN